MEFKQPHLIDLPRIYDPRGSLTFVEDESPIPFKIRRAYWIYDVPTGAERGSHCHKLTEQFIVAASGSFTVNLFDGHDTRSYRLESPSQGLYVPPGYWRTLDRFSSGALCLVLSSGLYSEADYIRDIDEYLKYVPGLEKS